MTLLVVDALDADVLDWLGQRHPLRCAPELAHDPRAFRRALADVRAMIVPAAVALDAPAFLSAPLLRAIGRIGGGAENIDLDACARARVELVRSPNASANAEAEFMLGAAWSLLRRVPVAGSDGVVAGRELGAASVGLVGMQPAARELARMLSGFGARVFGYDPPLHASDPLWTRWRVEPLGLRELVARVDVVCVQLAYYSRYRGLLGERFLPYCKPNQVIVSIAHAGLFDEAALAQALRSGRVAAAWLDCLEPGALDPGRPLHDIPTLRTTPRIASATVETRRRSAWAVARRLDDLLGGGPALRRDDFSATRPGAAADLEDGPAWP